MYKRLLIIAAATTALSSAAFAADLRGAYSETPAPFGALPFAPPPPGLDWSGPYVGLNVGYGGGSEGYTYDIVNLGVGGYDSHRDSGIVGGAQIGYNYALGNGVVFGVEADFSGSGIGGSAVLDSSAVYARLGSHMDYFGTARARLGYAFGRAMLYGTGGFAYAGASTDTKAPDNGIHDHRSYLQLGYAFGGGMEFAVTDTIMLRAEYLRLAFNGHATSGSDAWQMYHLTEQPTENIVRAGVDYKFDLFGPIAPVRPVVARY